MEWRRITAPEDPDFERVFGLYQEGFPLHEQRIREKQEAVLNNPAYFCCSLWERAGFSANPWPHVHPPYRSGFAGHELVVMTCPGSWDRVQYEAFAAFLKDTVMADCKYQNR